MEVAVRHPVSAVDLRSSPRRRAVGAWHAAWQAHFESKETTFYPSDGRCQFPSGRRFRIADAIRHDGCTIEFQSSPIARTEVQSRQVDYGLCNKGLPIIWVINGGGDHPVTTVSRSDGSVNLNFSAARWKYESFLTYDVVYVHLGDISSGIVHKVHTHRIKADGVSAGPGVAPARFIEWLKTGGTDPFDGQPTPPNPTIHVAQKGAGNGKTYSLVQLTINPRFRHIRTFIFLTKQHSAVHVIRQEIIAQRNRGLLKDIEFGDEVVHGNKRVLPFRATKGKDMELGWREIVTGTFDSFVYALAHTPNESTVDKFLQMVRSLLDGQTQVDHRTGRMHWAGARKLNNSVMFVGDEMQDLHPAYAKAMVRLTREFSADLFAVGDRMQSILIENNAFTFFAEDMESDDSVVVDKSEPMNKCRRFCDPRLVEFVNSIVDFGGFCLPEIEAANPLANPPLRSPLTIIQGETVYADTCDSDLVFREAENIMVHYREEVEERGRRPNDFIIVTPFVHNNPLVEALHQLIREYWVDRKGTDEYQHYSFFHKSEVGNSIDLRESDECTRIVSVHSAKGDGRPVAFVIGLSESALRVYSNKTNDLVYNSILNVALTRMEEQLYVRLEPTGDDFHRRCARFQNGSGQSFGIEPLFHVKETLRLAGDLLSIDTASVFDKYKSMIFDRSEQYKVNIDDLVKSRSGSKAEQATTGGESATRTKRVIDMKHHNFRYAAMVVASFLKIIQMQRCKDGLKHQLLVMLRKVSTATVCVCDTSRHYWTLLKEKKSERQRTIPLRRYRGSRAKKGAYDKLFQQLLDTVLNVKTYLRALLNMVQPQYPHGARGLDKLDPLGPLEFLVLYHIIEVHHNGRYTALPISDLYDLFFIEYQTRESGWSSYVAEHYRAVDRMSALWERFFRDNGDMSILYGHTVALDSSMSSELCVRCPMTFIAYQEGKKAVNIVLKPQFNTLNFHETLFENVFASYVLRHPRRGSHPRERSLNYTKFASVSEGHSCVLTLDLPDPYYMRFRDRETGADLVSEHAIHIKQTLRELMKSYYNDEMSAVVDWYGYALKKAKNEALMESGGSNPTAKTMIKRVLKAYDRVTEKRQNPAFVREALSIIDARVSDMSKKEGRNFLRSYDDSDALKTYLTGRVDRVVDDFFEHSESDSQSDSESECESDLGA